MTSDQILDRVSQIVGETLELEGLTLTPSMTAHDVLGWDSLAHVQIMVAIERAFQIRFRTGEMAALANVGELIKRIHTRVAAETR